MTRTGQLSALASTDAYPDHKMKSQRNFGPIGSRRPVHRLPPGLPVHVNDTQENSKMPSNSTQYALFHSPQQKRPFSHYQQPHYDGCLPPAPFQSSTWTQGNQLCQPLTTLSQPMIEQSTQVGDHLSPENNQTSSLNALASALAKIQFNTPQTSTPAPSLSPSPMSLVTDGSSSTSDSDDENEEPSSHPNKYPVEIERHSMQHCGYKRQPTRSGPKMKQQHTTIYDPISGQTKPQVQKIQYYQKHLVRMCRCGAYSQMDGALVHGRANDCDGYEIHYSQKCKWKAYDDYKTGKRVLIRLCKCYKPF